MKTTQKIKDSVRRLTRTKGLLFTIQVLGGVDVIAKYGYDNNLIDFANENSIDLVSITGGIRPVMYIDDLIVRSLPLKRVHVGSDKELSLGEFNFGGKTKFKFDARVYKVPTTYGLKWKVVGLSGSYGFGYSFISVRETLGKRYRTQIYQQIIDKYDLHEYIS
jgi:hypothetical protein